MTTSLFEEYIYNLDLKIFLNKRKVAIVIDNCPVHPVLPNLKSIELLRLPRNTTSKTQSMDVGVIKQFKGNYRRLLTRKRIHSFDAIIEFWVNLLDEINFIHTAWYQIPSSHIANCFHHAGFTKINSQPTDLSFSFTELDLIWDHMVESGLLSNDVSLNDYISFDD